MCHVAFSLLYMKCNCINQTTWYPYRKSIYKRSKKDACKKECKLLAGCVQQEWQNSACVFKETSSSIHHWLASVLSCLQALCPWVPCWCLWCFQPGMFGHGCAYGVWIAKDCACLCLCLHLFVFVVVRVFVCVLVFSVCVCVRVCVCMCSSFNSAG